MQPRPPPEKKIPQNNCIHEAKPSEIHNEESDYDFGSKHIDKNPLSVFFLYTIRENNPATEISLPEGVNG